MDQVIAWILSLMTSVSPVGRPQYVPEAKESVEEATVRYDSIAKDVIDVVFDPNEKPLFSGAKARIKTVSVLLAVANFESGFRRDVDLGIGPRSKGDSGASWCLNQINLGKVDLKGNTPRRIVVSIGKGFKFTKDKDIGWSGPDLVADRKKCFRAALALMRSSFASCGNNIPLDEKLQVYGSGSCGKGILGSKRRMRLAFIWASRAPDLKDQAIIDLVAQEKNTEDPSSDFRLGLNFSAYSSNPISFPETYPPLLKLESL